MCIGLSVEFNIHIVTYFWRKKGTRRERALKALENMGSTVLTGIAATKLIGVSVLGLAPSMIFQVYYFRMYLGIVFLGVFHGLCVTPLLLMYMGPKTRETYDKPKKTGTMLKISVSD
jgi:Niemann-Pick C1 protein